MSELTPFTRRRISALVEEALQQADVVGVIPTPIEAVQEVVGITDRIDMSNLPADLAAQKPPAWKRLLGATWFQERTVFIDTTEPQARQLFTDAHETAHVLCEWHAATLRLDNEDTLFRGVNDQIEAEANYGASCLIFQGARFHQRALQEQVSIRTPLALAEDYGASRHSTLHYYVEEHPDAVALLVAGRYPHRDGTLPIWRSVESQQFLDRFGRSVAHLPDGRLPISTYGLDPLAKIVAASRSTPMPLEAVVTLGDLTYGHTVPFTAEAFFNGRCHFVLLSERGAAYRGANSAS